jgi:tRNA dimethylallyltransferase
MTVLAIFGPTASGKSAVAEAIARRITADLIAADSAQLYNGLPILTNQSPAALVGVWPLDHEASVAEFQTLAHAAVDASLEGGRTPVVVGGTGLYFRAALAELEVPPPPVPGARERWGAVYDEDAERTHGLLAEVDPAAAVAVHPNDRRRVVRALELAEAGASLAGDELWTGELRHPTLVCSLVLDQERLENRIRARAKRMLAEGAVDEAVAAWSRPLSSTARKVLGLEEFATLPPAEAVEAVVAATRRLARYQRKWIRRFPGVVALAGRKPHKVLVDEIVALAGAGERLPRHR